MPKAKIIFILTVGLISISFASIFIKLCDAPSLVIASYRLAIASVFYMMVTRIKKGSIWRSLSWSQLKIVLVSGVFLTIHFATWISSLKYTSVANSVVLVQSAPIFVAIGSFIFLREKPSLLLIAGIVIAILGGLIISVADFSSNGNSLTGNILAVSGAIGAAGYMIAGRKLRKTMDTLSYVTFVYSIAAIFLIILTISNGVSFIEYNMKTYLLFIAIAVFPQIIGHTTINWSLKIFSATTVSIIILAEPIGSSILALLLLHETLSLTTIIGGGIILIGVIVVILAETKKS